MTIGAIYANIDYVYYPLEAVLPDPKYRKLSTILIALLIRILFALWGSVECWRTISLFAWLCLMLVSRFLRILQILMSQLYTFRYFYCNYIFLKLLYGKMKRVVWILTYVGLSSTFWILVTSCWVIVKGSIEQLSLPLYLVFVLAAVMILIGYAIVLPMACKGFEMAVKVVYLYRFRTKFQLARVRCFIYKTEAMKAKAIKPMELTYGVFWPLRMAFLGEYFWLIVLRTFDAILLVDF